LAVRLCIIPGSAYWAKERRMFNISRPIEVVVLNCWVTETKDTP
jgi:hypothetical protein